MMVVIFPGVHGGLMLLEPRFTAELLAALLNIPANKTLLRRHLTQRYFTCHINWSLFCIKCYFYLFQSNPLRFYGDITQAKLYAEAKRKSSEYLDFGLVLNIIF